MSFRKVLEYIWNEIPQEYQYAALRFSLGYYLIMKLILEAEEEGSRKQ